MTRSTQAAARGASRLAVRPHEITGAIAAPIRLVLGWVDRSRQRRALARFDSRMLHDIGITRAQADQECAKPFWRVD